MSLKDPEATHPASLATDKMTSNNHRPLYAAIDVGSNNLRLLIASVQASGEPKVVDAFSRTVRLGAHLNDQGAILEDALDKATNALRICAKKIRQADAKAYRAVATEVCRQAVNSDRLVAEIKQRTGLNLEVISCAEEARLAMLGVSPLIDPEASDCLVFDIGGGSSEIVWGQRQDDGQIAFVDHISLPFGVISLADRIDETEEARRASYHVLREELQVALMETEQRWQLRDRVTAGQVQVLGASGTVTTLAGLLMGLQKYVRHLVDGTDLPTAQAAHVIDHLLGQNPDERARNGCIGRSRCDMVLPGCAMFEAILGIWPVDKVRVADRGVREGILYDLSRQSA
ncbi:MAG: Ppx/GppA phosphatase family protein [Pseudomonadota bacterium]